MNNAKKLLLLSGKKAPVIPWYLAGGVDAANCVVAYQAIGAASFAASCVNLANPGTYDMAAGVNPLWATGTGWAFDGATQYLVAAGFPITDTDFSIVAYVNVDITASTSSTVLSTKTPFSSKHWSFRAEQFGAAGKIGMTAFAVADNASALSTPTGAGVLGMTRSGTSGVYYISGSSEAKVLPIILWEAGNGLYVGADYNPETSTPTGFLKGNIYALAYYNTVLTEPQMNNVFTNMINLP